MQNAARAPMDSEHIDEKHRLAAAVRSACVQAALNGYQNARMDGLCHEGAWECAIDAIRALDLEVVIEPDNSGS